MSNVAESTSPDTPVRGIFSTRITGLLVLSDGTVLAGQGIGAPGIREAELCFNTAMTGYQEILTDPSYAGQIVVFTFPHIGNVGTNADDLETAEPAVAGLVTRARITQPANYRSKGHLDGWLKEQGIVGLSGVDTRSLTKKLREKGFLNAVIAHHPDGAFDIDALKAKAAAWPGLEGMDLAPGVTRKDRSDWGETLWHWGRGFGTLDDGAFKVVVIDYGVKHNILRSLADIGCRVTVVPAQTTAKDILALKPDGIVLSNGPGDPAATGAYAIPVIKELVASGLPIFGICLGHQLLALALGARTRKMHQGHHGANHPVKDVVSAQVSITSMNHGFTVDTDSLPAGVTATHVSLFDGSNCGLALDGKPVFSVQYHPEASPGPQDSQALFRQFLTNMEGARRRTA